MIDGSNVRYVQFETPQGMGYGCFVVHWSRDNGELVYRVGSAYCNPKDSFSKELARTIARGRSLNNFQYGKVLSAETGYITAADFGLILSDCFKNNFAIVPGWARKAFSRGKYFFTLKTTKVTKGDIDAWKKTFAEAAIEKEIPAIRNLP